MRIEKEQQILLVDNTFLAVKEVEQKKEEIYSKSVTINTQGNKLDWSGGIVATSDLATPQVIPHTQLSYADLNILIPQDTFVLCKNENSYTWMKARFVRPGINTVVMMFGNTLMSEPVTNVSTKQIPSTECKNLITRDNSPMFIGVKKEGHKNYGICVIVKDEIS